MKRFLSASATALSLVFGVLAPATMAKGHKHSPEHKRAIAQCKTEYKAAVRDAKTKTGKDRKSALAAAKQSEKQCMSAAPK